MTSWISVSICGEDVEVTERFTYLGIDIHVSAGVSQRSTDVWVGPGESWISGSWDAALLVPVWEDESPSLQVLRVSSLALGL